MPASAPSTVSQLTSEVRLDRVEAVVNAASGSVGPRPEERLREVADRFGLAVNIRNVAPKAVQDALREAVATRPDLLILVAGDGTAALAAELCGMDGPLLAPLPGGTMNMLPHALYGRKAWPDALAETLARGVVTTVSGGEASGRPFHVAAILGAPALWAEAREALRKGRLRLAFLRARRALSRAFRGSLRFSLGQGPRQKAEALTLLCPLVSRAMNDDTALEAASLDPHGAGEAFRLGLRTLAGGWRDDPAVTTQPCTEGRAWARGRIPAILDGEPHRLDSPVTIRFKREAFRALVPPGAAGGEAERAGERTGAEAAGGAAAAEAVKTL